VLNVYVWHNEMGPLTHYITSATSKEYRYHIFSSQILLRFNGVSLQISSWFFGNVTWHCLFTYMSIEILQLYLNMSLSENHLQSTEY